MKSERARRKPEFLVALKRKKEVQAFKFPSRAQQMNFVAAVRKKWPQADFAYTVEDNKRKRVRGAPMKRDEQMRRLISTAVAYAEVAEAHRAHEMWATRTIQEAAELARNGDRHGARKLQAQVSLKHIVFDYENVHANLIDALTPFRKTERKE
jgi:hypothetical protein